MCTFSFSLIKDNNISIFFTTGLLVRVYSKAASWTIQYRYDGLGRRVASRNSLGQHLQFFYADLNYPTRITHVYNHSSSEITSFYYDLQVHTERVIWLTAVLLLKLEGQLKKIKLSSVSRARSRQDT